AVPIVRLGPIALSHSGTSAPAPRSAKLFRRSAPLTTRGRRSSSARASRVQGLQHEVAPRDVLLLEDDPAPEGQVGPQARPCDDVVLFTVAVEETVARPAIVCELGLRIRPLARHVVPDRLLIADGERLDPYEQLVADRGGLGLASGELLLCLPTGLCDREGPLVRALDLADDAPFHQTRS